MPQRLRDTRAAYRRVSLQVECIVPSGVGSKLWASSQEIVVRMLCDMQRHTPAQNGNSAKGHRRFPRAQGHKDGRSVREIRHTIPAQGGRLQPEGPVTLYGAIQGYTGQSMLAVSFSIQPLKSFDRFQRQSVTCRSIQLRQRICSISWTAPGPPTALGARNSAFSNTFFEYWSARGLVDQLPMPPRIPPPLALRQTFVPYIYTRNEVRLLLRAIPAWETSSWQTLRTNRMDARNVPHVPPDSLCDRNANGRGVDSPAE